MCGLFGFSAYCDQPIKNLSMLTNLLLNRDVALVKHRTRIFPFHLLTLVVTL